MWPLGWILPMNLSIQPARLLLGTGNCRHGLLQTLRPYSPPGHSHCQRAWFIIPLWACSSDPLPLPLPPLLPPALLLASLCWPLWQSLCPNLNPACKEITAWIYPETLGKFYFPALKCFKMTLAEQCFYPILYCKYFWSRMMSPKVQWHNKLDLDVFGVRQHTTIRAVLVMIVNTLYLSIYPESLK